MRPKFTIRMLMIVTVVAAIPCGWYAAKRRWRERRLEAISHLEGISGPVSWYNGGTSFTFVHGIRLHGQFIDEETWVNVAMLTEARSIVLSDTNTTDADLRRLRRFWNVRYLTLGGANVTSEGLEALAGFQSLETLILANTLVDDEAIPSLANLKSLTRLSIVGTCISDNGIEKLRKALPNCRIHHDSLKLK